MRVVRSGREYGHLPVDFERPPGIAGDTQYATRIQPHPIEPIVAMTLGGIGGGMTAVWHPTSGKLLWSPEPAADIGWAQNGTQCLVLSSSVEMSAGGGGNHHQLRRFSWPECRLLESLVFSTAASGGADQLVISPSCRWAASIGIAQGEWAYELLQIEPAFGQPGISREIPFWIGDCPAFSLDESCLVSVGSPGPGWWVGDGDDWTAPARGGEYRIGAIFAHELGDNQSSRHDLVVDLAAGWCPDDPDGQWEFIWGPEMISSDTFRIWLPDRHSIDLRMPLSGSIKIDHRLDPTTIV